jgi:hypothetical protein
MDMIGSRPHRRVTFGRILGAMTLAAVMAAVGSPVPAGAATREQASPVTASLSIAGGLAAVAATSANSAWAVGSSGSFPHPARPLIVHWNGTRWTQAPTSGLPDGMLSAVAATSASNAWAVGGTTSGQTLILHWNGASWKKVPSAGAAGSLAGVAASSATSAWAVGSGSGKALILHWNGTSWKKVPSPSPGGHVYLNAVAVTSGRGAWAVGEVFTGSVSASLILRWTGSAWQRVAIPVPSEGRFGNSLTGVASASASSAWAVGCTDGCPVGGTPLIERWNGTSWRQVAAPRSPYALYNLGSVAVSGTRAWAVGGGGPVTAESAATAYWNGRGWTLAHGIPGAGLTGVTAISATNAWAVGGTAKGRILILHWNGTSWN